MFSSTTIASSTTRPIDSTMPSSVSVLMENPAAAMMPNAPTIDTGMAMTGISVVRHSRKNANTTSTTSANAMTIVSDDLEQRAAHVLRVVVRDLDLDVVGHLALDLREPAAQLVDDLDLVGARPAAGSRGPAIGVVAHLERAALVLRAELGVADVAETHDAIADALDDECVELRRRVEARQGLHGELDGARPRCGRTAARRSRG